MKKFIVCNEHHEIPVYDNCHCKPPMIGARHQSCSMIVVISAHGSFFAAQFTPNEGVWHVHFGSALHDVDGNVPKLVIPDNEVEYWFHCPGYEGILEHVRREGPTSPNASSRNDPFENLEIRE